VTRFSTTNEAKKRLEKKGYPLVFIVERFLMGGKFKHDLLKAIDVLGYHPKLGWIGIQATTQNWAKEHLEDLNNNERLKRLWLDFGFNFELWIWPEKDGREAGEDIQEVRF